MPVIATTGSLNNSAVNLNKSLPGSVNYQIERSLRFRRGSAGFGGHLRRTPTTTSNTTTWTWSSWIKSGPESGCLFYGGTSVNNTKIEKTFSNGGQITIVNTNSSVTNYNWGTTGYFNDPTAWYHIIVVFDTTQATSTDRIKVYVNGVRLTLFSTQITGTQNQTGTINANTSHYIGVMNGNQNYFDGYMAEVNFIDGQALTPSSLGVLGSNGVWQPKKYTGTYGTNGFYLRFNNTANIGEDSSGNGNNWTNYYLNTTTANTTYDSMLDVPTDNSPTAANFATFNPLFPGAYYVAGSSWQMSGAMLSISGSSSLGVNSSRSTISVPATGQYYHEVYVTRADAGGYLYGGSAALYRQDGSRWTGSTWVAYANSYTAGDTIGCAVDATNNTVTWYKNGASQGQITTNVGLARDGRSDVWGYDGAGVWTLDYNFGQRPFTYTPPTGFKMLNTYNLPNPPIPIPEAHFKTTLWTGTGSNTFISNRNANTQVTMAPGLVWGKVRSTTYGHNLFDVVRGAGTLKDLNTNSTNPEGGNQSNTYGYISSFNSNGFSVTAGSDPTLPNAYWNQTSNTYVAWQWKGGGTSVTNTDGSITSQVSANPIAGFSIVTYSGTGSVATVGHGLKRSPDLIILKNRNKASGNWVTYHSSLGANGNVYLNLTNAYSPDSSTHSNTNPNSTVFTVATSADVNGIANNILAYCFASIPGYSAFGTYTGNLSYHNGPFINLGFRPSFIMIKRYSGTPSNWYVWDSSRYPYNNMDYLSSSSNVPELYPNLSNAEANGTDDLEFTANGFKVRNYNDAGINGTNNTFIYAAFAEMPFKYARGR